MRTTWLAAVLVMAGAQAVGQPSLETRLIAYEIRPSGGLPFVLRPIYDRDRNKGGTAFFAATSLAHLLATAMKVDRRRVFGPAWIYESRYEVYFRTRQVTSALTPLLSELLVRTFHLKYRTGRVATAVPVLSTPRGEPRLKPSRSTNCRSGSPAGEAVGPYTGIRPPPSNDTAHAAAAEQVPLPLPNLDAVLFSGCRVADVIPQLEQYLGEVILDETTAQGRFRFSLELPNSPAAPEHRLPAVAWQLNRKLGAELRFERRVVDDALVIDGGAEIRQPVGFGM